MNCGDDASSPPYSSSYQHGVYNSSVASSASSSSSSVWSESLSLSQSSDASSVDSTDAGFDSYNNESQCFARPSRNNNIYENKVALSGVWQENVVPVVAVEQRQNPRRTSGGAVARLGCPPLLVRQNDRKVNFVDSLVDSSAQIVEAIWPTSSVPNRSECHKGVLPLRKFIQETLRRSKTSYSTLQVALYYLILIKPHVPKCDFTMEQQHDAHSARALQCGRRMFLAALILASKYLQDRNYSARAWSRISGLGTQEIHQNEIAFLLAVNWRLHITDDVFQRWTDIVLKYTSSLPPSPGAFPFPASAEPSPSWKTIILHLTPGLDNVEVLTPPVTMRPAVAAPVSPMRRSYLERTCSFESTSSESTPTPRQYTPHFLEPSPSATYPSNKFAPAMGLLPTPRLTPQSMAFGTPAVSTASYLLNKSSMGYAMAQAATAMAGYNTERWPGQCTSSPSPYNLVRRSSLANSVSSASSPESMISDTSSRSSRRSSISSASLPMSAPLSSKLDVQARCRYAKQCCDRTNSRTVIATVPEDCVENGLTTSPESYTGMVGKDFLELSLGSRLVQPCNTMYDYSRDTLASDAARTLQELHNHPRSAMQAPSPSKAGAKRSRTPSIDNPLQDNVRDMLISQYQSGKSDRWSESLVRSRFPTTAISYATAQAFAQPVSRGSDGRKRVCCSTESSNGFIEPAVLNRLGMWDGILQ